MHILLFLIMLYFLLSNALNILCGDFVNSINVGFVLFLWILVHILDCHSTLLCMSTNNGREANPIARFAMYLLGPKLGLISMKVIFLTLFTQSLLVVNRVYITAWIIIFMGVVINNYVLYSKLKVSTQNPAL